MRTTNLSFFKMLARLETKYNLENAYPKYARDVLDKLISFVQNCNYDRSESRKFISLNFRGSPEWMCDVWNKQHPDKEKHIKTFYSQISTFSNDLYALFGEDIEIYFTEFKDEEFGEMEFKKEIVEVSTMIDALNLESEGKLGVFISDFENDLAHVKPSSDCSLADCENEIKCMRKLLRRDVLEIEKSMDMRKAAWIYRTLRTPIFKSAGAGKHVINKNKVKILQSLNLLPEKEIECREPSLLNKLDFKLSQENIRINEEVDMDKVEELRSVLYAYFTPEGFREFSGRFTFNEWKEAINFVIRGKNAKSADTTDKDE